MTDELLYRIALTQVPGLGPVHARLLFDHLGSATAIFKASKKILSAVEGIGEIRASLIKNWHNFILAEKEAEFCRQQQVKLLFLSDPGYPQKLLHCYDAPVLLYYRGVADLNNTKVISIIGTRANTAYGRLVTEELIESLKPLNPLIISGLAYGIDAITHRASLKQQIETVGVLAHGFNTIYPSHHSSLAKEMLKQGGLITEFGKDIKADKHNFPRRNRIVAGLSDATVVIETACKGGSMITATFACNYNRDVFAVPGRINDPKSEGCLQLIRQNKAMIFTSGAQLMDTMGWLNKQNPGPITQKELFIELSPDEQKILAVMQAKNQGITMDELCLVSALPHSVAVSALLNLEIQQVIRSLPGNRYQLL